jgi:hypothetical protein
MKPNSVFLTRNLLLLSIGVVLIASVLSCNRAYKPKDIEVTSKTRYSGAINGSPVTIDVLATINTGRGGRSACTFTGPSGFNPAVLGTMA